MTATLDAVAGIDHKTVRQAHDKPVNKPTLEDVARFVHEVNRLWCQFIGDNSQPSWEDAPDWQKNSALEGVRYHLSNPSSTHRDSHTNWLSGKQQEGWKFGAVKDPEKKEHPCFCEFGNLPWYQQIKDHLFLNVVRTLEPLLGTREVTPGDRNIGRSFNPGNDWRIDLLKEKYADLFNLVSRFGNEHGKAPYANDDYARIQVGRNTSLSLTYLEESKMRVVEAITR